MHRLQLIIVATAAFGGSAMPTATVADGPVAEAGTTSHRGRHTAKGTAGTGAAHHGAAAQAAGAARNAVGLGGERVSAADAVNYELAMKGGHRTTGTVATVNRHDGVVVLHTNDGILAVPLARDALTSVDAGHELTVELGYVTLPVPVKDGARAAANAHGVAAQHADRWLNGTVTRVEHDTGRLHVRSGDVTAALRFPPPSVTGVKAGDRVAIKVVLVE